VAQPFNPSKLQIDGKLTTVTSGVGAVESFLLAQISVSNDGTLAYESAGRATRQLVWMDRAGKILSTLGEPGNWGPPRISPDGKSVVAGKADALTGRPALWILDAAGRASQFSDTPLSRCVSPQWSPDGARIVFGNDQLGTFDLYVQPVEGPRKAQLLFRNSTPKQPDDWSPDGKLILFRDVQPGLNSGIYAFHTADGKVGPIADTIYAEAYAALSHDGKWLAYESNVSGSAEVLVQAFENGAGGVKKYTTVSKGGGGFPRWRRDGSELYYMNRSGGVFAVGFHAAGDDFVAADPKELFHTRPSTRLWNLYDVSADGERFLMNMPMEWPRSSRIYCITSWSKALER
jgi:Tol biopolymer transport system component